LAGTLFVVATPIGNLEDITYRAARILGEAAVIACEDTRQSARLLDHYGISRPRIALHEHNERERAPELVERLRNGENVALITDAGTPLVSDPGFRLVRLAIEAGIRVEPVPGPSAAIAALSASGLETDAFRFCGFLPAKAGARRHALEALAGEDATLIFYEAPHRVLDMLADLAAVMPDRPVVAAREVTKFHEEFLRGSAEEVRSALGARPSVLGEFTVLAGKRDPNNAPPPDAAGLRAEVAALIAQGLERMEAIKRVAKAHGMAKRDVYSVVETSST
jgi:16S rRNA (cytidine1402-2'-O)-methyltransferase